MSTLEHYPRLRSSFNDRLRDELVSLRRQLHQHPELAFQEEHTADRLFEALSSLLSVEVERVTRTGLVARVRGRTPGAPIVALRGDIDALPIQEETGLEYASVSPGVMHACGHDVHATWAVGAANLLVESPAEGEVLIILQPAEEAGRGARAIIETKVLEGVSAIFGAHVDRRFLLGQVVAQDGALAASTDTFDIELIGKGAHGARPHEAADPIVGAGALIGALQTIVSRRLNPSLAGVVTVGTVHAGTAHNIIPDRAKLSGTLRATDAQTRSLLAGEVCRITEAIASVHHLQAHIRIDEGTPPVVNPPEPVSWARQAVTTILGKDALVPLGTLNMAGEDFAYYMEKIPGCFLRIGAREQGGPEISAHSSQFYPAEESIFVGAAVLAETARIASAFLRQRTAPSEGHGNDNR